MRKDYQGAGVTAEYGQTDSGGGQVKTITGIYGLGDLNKDRYNFNILATYQKTDAIYGSDRSYSKSGINYVPSNPNATTNNDVTSGNTYPGNIANAIALPPNASHPDGAAAGTTIGNPMAGNCGPYSVTSPFFDPSVAVTTPHLSSAPTAN